MCSFQRCGNIERQTVAYYKTLDELYTAEQVDNVILARDWHFNWDLREMWYFTFRETIPRIV